ncbi:MULTISPECIES: hypothetical protein [Gordonia]|uniref:hypothetical protein n=1 Tax=Gordonia TaxID=2053 RepID=UPI00226EA98A|nr:hypothetical protein [Gordonia sp. SL306]WAC55939.1 hypothetical protein OVA31_01305 [Gordonia sp. SL306]
MATDRPDGPEVFSLHLEQQLQREYDRKAMLTARGEIIARTVLSILTVLVAGVALGLGASIGIRPHAATWIVLGVAALVGISALVAASLAQSASSRILSSSDDMLREMVGERWNDTAEKDPQLVIAKRHAEAIIKLREANEKRARQAKAALALQLIFIIGLVAAVAIEVVMQVAQN